MKPQSIKFVTGYGGFGGSTIALIEHCKLLDSNGYDVKFYFRGEWAKGRYYKSFPISDLSIEEDDIVIYHHIELDQRPSCKKSLLYLHEKSLWDLNSRKTSGFDAFVYVSQDQKNFHMREGFVVPNPIYDLVDRRVHNPPDENIAGIVGTIQSRKMQHVSILKALEDGRKKVLLFGDYEGEYFDSYIKPLLSDKVLYMGFYEPSRRMEMYNQFDYMYIFSSDESASLALGECRILNKPVFKGPDVKDYPIVDPPFVLKAWSGVFESKIESQSILKNFCKTSKISKCENLVCVVTYDRKEIVSKWLRAWNNAEKFGAKIAVLHACDGDEPNHDQMENILSHEPDFYIPFKNSELKDMGAFMLVTQNKMPLPDWNYLFWFTDDFMPMRRDFLKPFVEKIRFKNTGLVAHCYEPLPNDYEGDACLPHIRTVAYALTRKSANSLSFPDVGLDKEKPFLFEHGRKGMYEDHILNQILKNGFGFKTCHADDLVGLKDYIHWTEVLDHMWDCHLFADGTNFGKHVSSKEYWEIYEKQFDDDLKKNADERTVFSPYYCEKLTLIPGKVCAIIPTFSSPINCFMWSVFSLLLRSNHNLEHVVIGINGPDSREGNKCLLQDKKQSFVEELRGLSWKDTGFFNPGAITLVRTWSRIGHAQMLEQCINWVHTEFYLSMHDDVIVLDRNWSDSISDFKDDRLVAKVWGNSLMAKMHKEGSTLKLPHFNTIFSLCSKPSMRRIGANWIGYDIEKRFKVGDYLDFEKFMTLHDSEESISKDCVSELRVPNQDTEYLRISMDIGSFVHSKIREFGMKVESFNENVVKHFEGVSWRDSSVADGLCEEVKSLEAEIAKVPQYKSIYFKYKDV